jgi:hypothetical protein
LNDLYHENTEFDVDGHVAQGFQKLLSLTQDVMRDRPYGSGKTKVRKNRIFSLFLFLRLLAFSPVSMKRARPDVARLFWATSDEQASPDDEPTGRVGSATTLEKHYQWFADRRMADLRLPELDTQRFFTPKHKVEIWEAANGKCGICSEQLAHGEEEYDHIEPWILGGRTIVQNGRPVHLRCHPRGLAAVDGRTAPVDRLDS